MSDLWRSIFSWKMGVCIVLGFASGLPLYVLISLLSAYLRTQDISLSSIALVTSAVMVPYTWKFMWAPLLDRYTILGFSRRRGWMLLCQGTVMLCIAWLGFISPKQSLWLLSLVALLVSLFSASSDIAIDAYRREFLSDAQLGLGNSLFVNAYRVASLIPGGVSLILADLIPWSEVFVFTAICMLPAIIITLIVPEERSVQIPRTLRAAIIEPWYEFINRQGLSKALLLLCFVFFYKLGDSMCTALATPFYIDLGYSLTAIGIIAKNVGLWSMVLGGIVGGIWMLRLHLNNALWIFGFCQLLPIAGFAFLARAGVDTTPSLWLLSLVIGTEALGTGLGTAAFVSFIAASTNKAYTATQFALLTSLSALPRTVCNATTGYLVEALSWESFFWLCLLLATPGMLLLIKVAPPFKKPII